MERLSCPSFEGLIGRLDHWVDLTGDTARRAVPGFPLTLRHLFMRSSMTSIPKAQFIREYSKSLVDGNAALFVGAGLSQAAGFVNWKELLREIAADLGLEVEQGARPDCVGPVPR